ncbi:hypothetical protein G5C33_10055 [Sphingosinithalassobacter tenebrarum]|uniref:Uncharacterized protein n=2 Tax=Stakelama tenebrarum TaxID=2711215 RepID=A0A6G6YAB8_9SPHN|nr:hypothetical protein G5C33_10055 [Sphingosinithalassobacter tenebrarum]
MRGIEARYHRQALAERREAQAEHRARTAPAPSDAGWNSDPAPRRRKSKAAIALEHIHAEKAANNRSRWSCRHLELAREERALRKENAAEQERWRHKHTGTPQTHEHASRVNQGALSRLYHNGTIDADQLAAAVEIAGVAERIGADVHVRTASLETRVDRTPVGDGSFFEALGAVRREVAYGAWRKRLGADAAAVLDMIVGDAAGYSVVARRHSMHARRAKRLLIDALDAWPAAMRSACRDVDEATLAAAQAGLG